MKKENIETYTVCVCLFQNSSKHKICD